MAAAVYVTHKVPPLDHATSVACRARPCSRPRPAAAAQRFAADIADVATALVPFAPDSNLVCLALNPRGNRDVARMNAFVRRLNEGAALRSAAAAAAEGIFGSLTT